ncbi:TPA: hypothetical protein ACX6QP_000347 [Photobacterium damselae]
MLFKKSILSIALLGIFSLSNVAHAIDFGDICSNSGGNFVDSSSSDAEVEISPLLNDTNQYILNISGDSFSINLMDIGGKDKINLLQKAIVNNDNIDVCTKRGNVTSIRINNKEEINE